LIAAAIVTVAVVVALVLVFRDDKKPTELTTTRSTSSTASSASAQDGTDSTPPTTDAGQQGVATTTTVDSPTTTEVCRYRTPFGAMYDCYDSTGQPCRNSKDPKCGPGTWFEPHTTINAPLEISWTISPPEPQVGQEVTFTLTLRDADAQPTRKGTWLEVSTQQRDSTVGPSAADLVPIGGLPRDLGCADSIRYGPWDTPAMDRGELTLTGTRTFSSPGVYHVRYQGASGFGYPGGPECDGDNPFYSGALYSGETITVAPADP
jgi:hypothetical protein